MPTINKAPAAKLAAGTPANGKPATVVRPIKHPEPKLYLRIGDKAVTVEQAKELLGWETEGEYATRRIHDNPRLKAGTKDTTYGEDYTLLCAEEKVRCFNNAGNREYIPSQAAKIRQDILTGNWRLNGENMIIGRTGLVVSCQHRLIGFILAEWERLNGPNAANWQKRWPDPLTLETCLAVGFPEDPDTLKTLDNTAARTLGDIYMSMGLFDDVKVQEEGKWLPASRKAKAELCRMLDAATDLLWRRLGANESQAHKYQTHSESERFLQSHKRLILCVKHLWTENQNRGISHPDLRLSPGQCAAACYLMGCSATDYSDYHTKDEPGDKHMDWQHWDRARQFWSELAGDKPPCRQVRLAIKGLKDETELSGRMVEKLMVCAKAWDQYKQGKKPDQQDCELMMDDAGGLEEWPSFGGPDLGPKKPKAETEAVPGEEDRKAEAGRIRAEKLQASVDKAKATHAGAREHGKPIARPVLVPIPKVAPPRAPGEVAKPAPVQLDKEGKPPAPKIVKK